MPETRPFQQRMQAIDAVLQRAERSTDPAAQSLLQELAAGLMEIHALGLQKLMEQLFAAGGPGEKIVDDCLKDEAVSGLLVLHGLHPLGIEDRVRGALEKVGPYLASHGGHVELLSVSSEGRVALRLEGSCHGCPSSRVTLQSTIEQEILSAAPEVVGIDVEGLIEEAPPSTGFVPIEGLGIPTRSAVAT